MPPCAASQLNGVMFNGRSLRVTEAQERPSRSVSSPSDGYGARTRRY
jgi:RNA recognition motif-containing protein